MSDDNVFERLARESDEERPEETRVPARLLSRTYTAMVDAQQQSGPLLDVSQTKKDGHSLCVFEELVEIAPAGQAAKQMFHCRVCHARVLAEHLEHAPIWWPHCPYSEFQK
ncbi:MAG TPA: hypothetical protein DEH78_30610 [Solibacterales bacterium]|nr:hypothetical protein [Bryobacterales bacterium]